MQPPLLLYRAPEKTGHRPSRPRPQQDTQVCWSSTCTPIRKWKEYNGYSNITLQKRFDMWIKYLGAVSRKTRGFTLMYNKNYLHSFPVIPQVKGAVPNPEVCILLSLANIFLKLDMTQQHMSRCSYTVWRFTNQQSKQQNFKLSIWMVKKSDLSDNECGMVVGARLGARRISGIVEPWSRCSGLLILT